ncbi:MAG: response regulator, partial [Planctomycetes bacterium]|nr:response regulator [Planctomycetota bacterium]
MPSSLHVVAIDDDAADLAMVRRAVHRITDIDIDIETFSDPYRGLEYIATHDVHAIFLDFDLGPCDALEILNEIQARHIHTPVIILTGHESTDLAVETVHHGAADFLPKGRLSQQSLQRSLKNALEKSELQQQIESHRQELEMRNIELERRNDEISRFYHHVSHELKTPLTSAREFVSIVLDEIAGEITAQQREYLSISLDSCNEMVRHLNDLLDVTRIETGKLSLEKEDVDLTDLVARSAEAMRPTVDKAQLSLVVEAPPETCRASVDPGRVRQIVS